MKNFTEIVRGEPVRRGS